VLAYEIIFTKSNVGQLIRAWILAFFMLINHVTLWPWPLTRWRLNFVVYQVSRDQNLYEIWIIPSWIIDNFANFCTRYVMLWPWPVTSLSWTFTALRRHAFKLCTKFERKHIMYSGVIDDLTRFKVQFYGVRHFCLTVLRSAWTQLHQTWLGHRAIIPTQEVCFSVQTSAILLHFQTRAAQSWLM